VFAGFTVGGWRAHGPPNGGAFWFLGRVQVSPAACRSSSHTRLILPIVSVSSTAMKRPPGHYRAPLFSASDIGATAFVLAYGCTSLFFLSIVVVLVLPYGACQTPRPDVDRGACFTTSLCPSRDLTCVTGTVPQHAWLQL